MSKPELQPRTSATAGGPKISTDDQLFFYRKKIEELEQIKADEETKQMDEEVKLLQKVAAMGYTIVEKELTIANDVDEEPKPFWYAIIDFFKGVFQYAWQGLTSWTNVSSSKGLATAMVTLATLLVGFMLYPSLGGKLNDSEVRIHNAAIMHFLSHAWMGIAVMLLGFGFQFLAFNQHFKYLWTDIDTEESAHDDFKQASTEGKIRLMTALFTWAFPVWIITQMFMLILG